MAKIGSPMFSFVFQWFSFRPLGNTGKYRESQKCIRDRLKKKLEIKSCHNINWEDNYSWIHQKNILEVLRDKSKLLPEVKDYLEEENKYIVD